MSGGSPGLHGECRMIQPTVGLTTRLRSGIEGLDRVLKGGLPENHVYLVYGKSGTGKTTLGLQFLLEGAARGESCLYVTFSESRRELDIVVQSHGWSLEKVHVYETPQDYARRMLQPQTFFPPAEVELPQVLEPLLERVRALKPARMVVDSLAEIRFMAQDPFRYRREARLLKETLLELGCTAVFLDEKAPESEDMCIESLFHGMIVLEQTWPAYGKERRRLYVVKMRATSYIGGYHDFTIDTGGLSVYPRLVASEHEVNVPRRLLSTGLPDLDALLGGGFESGTNALLLGPAGSGKSNLATQVLVAGLERGERGAFYAFEETLTTSVDRSEAIGLPIESYVNDGRLYYAHVDPAELSAGQFAVRVMDRVRRDHVRIVVLDTLNGYLNAMPGERFLSLQLHELLVALNEEGVLSLLLVTQPGLLGAGLAEEFGLSYLADVVIALRLFEDAGRVRRALSVVKKRIGRHDESICEFFTGHDGLRIGPPLKDFQGILSGPLVVHGPGSPIWRDRL
jgi:circadian clock protein KaiC